jgi:hypothetical protein
MTESAYPVTGKFINLHLFNGAKEPEKMQLSNSLASVLNKAYRDGKANGRRNVDGKKAYLKQCKNLMKKAGLWQYYVLNHEFYVILLLMISDAYTEGHNEGKEE